MKPAIHRYIVPTTIFLLLGIMQSSGQNLLKNGNFESLNGSEPSNWATSNIPKMLAVVSPAAQSHGGKYAMKCEVKDFYGSKLAGMLTQKNIELKGTALELSGYYVLNSVGKDAGFVSLELQTAAGNTVKICHENLTKSGGEFTLFKITGNIPADAVRAEIRLTLLAGEGSEKLHEGSSILFDDLKLVSVAAPEEKTAE